LAQATYGASRCQERSTPFTVHQLLHMALLSTAPPAHRASHQFAHASALSWPSSSSVVPMPLLKAAVSASAAAAAGLTASSTILSTEEVKVSGKTGALAVSVPRFCGSSSKKASFRAPPGLEGAGSGKLAKPPGVHIAPPPGLAHCSEEVRNEFQFPPPPPFPPSELQSLASEEDVEERNDESDFEVLKTNQLPLPSLLASTPLPSLLGSAPLYGKYAGRNFKAHTFSAEVEPFVPAKKPISS